MDQGKLIVAFWITPFSREIPETGLQQAEKKGSRITFAGRHHEEQRTEGEPDLERKRVVTYREAILTPLGRTSKRRMGEGFRPGGKGRRSLKGVILAADQNGRGMEEN